jgi:hypothetical protein
VRTSVTEVVLEWVGPCKYFLLQDKNADIAYQEIAETKRPFKIMSCLFVLRKFLNRSKEKPQRYRMTIEHLGDA